MVLCIPPRHFHFIFLNVAFFIFCSLIHTSTSFSVNDPVKLIVNEKNDHDNTPPPQPTATKNQAKRERPRIPVLQYHDNWVCVK